MVSSGRFSPPAGTAPGSCADLCHTASPANRLGCPMSSPGLGHRGLRQQACPRYRGNTATWNSPADPARPASKACAKKAWTRCLAVPGMPRFRRRPRAKNESPPFQHLPRLKPAMPHPTMAANWASDLKMIQAARPPKDARDALVRARSDRIPSCTTPCWWWVGGALRTMPTRTSARVTRMPGRKAMGFGWGGGNAVFGVTFPAG